MNEQADTTLTARDIIAATLRKTESSGESCEIKARIVYQALITSGFVVFRGHPHA
jgi:hypothetical protein